MRECEREWNGMFFAIIGVRRGWGREGGGEGIIEEGIGGGGGGLDMSNMSI